MQAHETQYLFYQFDAYVKTHSGIDPQNIHTNFYIIRQSDFDGSLFWWKFMPYCEKPLEYSKYSLVKVTKHSDKANPNDKNYYCDYYLVLTDNLHACVTMHSDLL